MYERCSQEQLDQMEIDNERYFELSEARMVVASINNINCLYCLMNERLTLLIKNRRKHKKEKKNLKNYNN
jgi:hypothetical protein